MIDDTSRQRSLSLKFEGRRWWPAFEQELRVDQTGGSIILDICSSNDWISYSRTARHYDMPNRYRHPLYTYRRVVGQVDFLDGLGLIEHDRRAPGVRGWQSAIKATPELRSIHDAIVQSERPPLRKPAEVIVLRDAHKRPIDYRDTRDLNRMRARCDVVNEAITSAGLDPSIAAPVARIFNENMKRGGRFYAMGASWQNVKSEARKSITIGGEPVVELDYCTLHPAILYAETGAPMPADCYALDGWPRKLVKVAMLTLINAPTIHAARQSIAHSDLMAGLEEPGSQGALARADALIRELKAMHRPIAASFHSDAGARLMNVDATLADTVMAILLAQGVVVLPVHDSFLVPQSKRLQLESAMMDAAYRAGLPDLQVAAK